MMALVPATVSLSLVSRTQAFGTDQLGKRDAGSCLDHKGDGRYRRSWAPESRAHP